ncbi:MAG: urease accessory protein UreD [Pseudomonadota bacterium]
MFDAGSPSDAAVTRPPAPLAPAALQRARGKVQVGVKADGPVSRLAHLYQAGSAKCILPKVEGGGVEAVFVNTAGGITGGDSLVYEASAAVDAALTVTTQAAERVYRAAPATGDGALTARITLAENAYLDWLPQETILFEGGRLRRRVEVTMPETARLLALESTVLGRRAMGERVETGAFLDHWRVRRGGRLVFADAIRLSEPIHAATSGPATLGGARAWASLLYVAPDAEDRLDAARLLLGKAAVLAAEPTASALPLEGVEELGDGYRPSIEWGASCWDGILFIRLLASHGAPLRRVLRAFLPEFRGVPLPRVWSQ